MKRIKMIIDEYVGAERGLWQIAWGEEAKAADWLLNESALF